MAEAGKKKGLFGYIGQGLAGLAGAGTSVVSGVKAFAGYDVEVINPEGDASDAAEEAEKSRFKKEERDSYFKMMQKYIGADVTSMVTLPVIIFEPMTMLQKMAELMEYTELLDKADETDDPNMRMVYSVAWAISVYYSFQRTWKPFNPILGETYEFKNDSGVHFVAEQVSHHPPMSAGHAESSHFAYDCTSKLKTKFLGNSMDVYPVGRTQVTLKRSGHVLRLVPPPTKVHNLIFGRTWVDNPGDMLLTNLATGDKVVLYFQPCGWLGQNRYEVDGYVFNAAEEPQMLITGKWNSSLSCQPCDLEGDPVEGTQLQEVWRRTEAPQGDRFQYTHFAHRLNSFASAPPGLLPSDSRLRPDRLALEKGDLQAAGLEKARLEERQRAEKRLREERKSPFAPKWFQSAGEQVETPWGDMELYQFSGAYREKLAEAERSVRAEDAQALEFSPWQFDSSQVSLGEVKAAIGIVQS